MPKKPSVEASEAQLDVLRYLVSFIEEHGFQPTQSDMATHFGVTKNAIQARLKELAKRQIINMPAGEKARERAISLKHVKFKAYYVEEQK